MQAFLHSIPLPSCPIPIPTRRVLTTSFAAKAANIPLATVAAQPSGAVRFRVLHNASHAKHTPPFSQHPETPERVEAILNALRDDTSLEARLDVTPVHYDEQDARLQPAIERVHRFPDYLNNVKRICESGGGRIDPDTYLTAESYEVAREAVQTWLDGADEAMENGSAFVVARPPGHHATPASGMGFCLLSNAAIAARYLQDTREISRIGIVDFDVHHGNGTEAAVKNVEGIRFASSHQWPFYPGTGMPGVIGKFNGVKNFVLSEGDDIEAYREVFEQMLEFVAEDEGPEAVIVSAGFDAMRSDHVAGLCLETKDYKWMAGKMRERFGSIPVLFGLEGGYDVSEDGVGEAVKQCIRGWLFEADEE